MRLKSLQLHGFKSFADNTEFEFHPGVTAIVGPNGCGKSNVVDGIRWVLGETSAKALRGGEMADVIFNGTDKRKPVGMAEVTLTFTDCEETLNVNYNEVGLTRRVFRDGKSEYRINDKLCRLKDIQNLLMDTGIGRSSYSIMEQGKIDMLLSSKPEDRRTVFEEAAGITKFKFQKREALRKLDYTESNLVRVSDIITELQRQRNSLQRQANKARRYRELLDDLTTLDTHLAHRQFRELNAEREELTNSIASLQKQEEECRNEIEQRSFDLSSRREQLEAMESQFHELSQKQMTLRSRIQNSQDRTGFNRERGEELERFITQNEQAVTETGQKLEEQRSALAQAEQSLTMLVTKLDDQRGQVESSERVTQEVRQRRVNVQQQPNQAQQRAQHLTNQVAGIEASHSSKLEQQKGDAHRIALMEEEAATLKGEGAQFETEIEQLTGSVQNEVKALEDCQEKRDALEASLRDLRTLQEQKRTKVREVERAMSGTRSRLDVVQRWVEQGEGFEKGTQSVLKGLGDPDTYKNSVRGVLGTMLNVTDEDCMGAVEAAMREHLQTVLVANGTIAESMIDRLSEQKMGYASVLPEDLNIEKPKQTPDASGTACLLSVLRPNDTVRDWCEKAFCHVFIAKTLSEARQLQQKYPGCAFVTRKGESVTAEGIVHGGSTRHVKDSILQKQAEITKLQAQFAEHEKEHEEIQAQATGVEEQLKGVHTEREALQESTQQHRLNRSRMEDRQRLAKMELQRVSGRQTKLEHEKNELATRQQSIEAEVQRLQDEQKTKQEEIYNLQAKARETESELNSLSEQEAESSNQVNQLRTSLALEQQAEQALRKQRTPMAGRLEELSELRLRHEKDMASQRERLVEIHRENKQLDEVIASSKEEVAEVDKQLTESSEKRKAAQQDVRGLEDLLARKNQERGALQEQRGREEVRTTQLDLRVESTISSIAERYQVEIANFRPDAHQLLLALESQQARNRRARTNKIEVSTPAPKPETEAEAEVPAEVADSEPTEEDEVTASDQPENEVPTAEANFEEEGVEIEEGAEPNWAFIEASVTEMRRKLDSMGPVNLDAIKEFEETEERLQFLSDQHNDLTNSKEELLRVLAKINTESRKQFAETFQKVRENFKLMFRELFGDTGKADLVLLDEDDPLESGIDIIVKPPGKKLQTISLLSGGERSMTAVALLFAIYMVKPSPFCVLDELDAPLDESNIARFVKMLDRFITQSQFVIITHSKRTMSRADVMYGVTMQEFGVSKPVGMKLTSDEATAAREAKARAKAQQEAPAAIEENASTTQEGNSRQKTPKEKALATDPA